MSNRLELAIKELVEAILEEVSAKAPPTTSEVSLQWYEISENLPTRTVNALARNGITPEMARSMTDEQILELRWIGQQGLDEIRRTLTP